MEIFVQILKQLPTGWPRITILLGIGLLFLLPELRRVLMQKFREKGHLEEAKQLLELRDLELSVEEKKAALPELANDALDVRIRELLQTKAQKTPQQGESIDWIKRLKFALAGSFGLMLLGTIALWQAGKFEGQSPLHVIPLELGYTAICALLASAIPARIPWECVLRGVLIPAFLGAMIATVAST